MLSLRENHAKSKKMVEYYIFLRRKTGMFTNLCSGRKDMFWSTQKTEHSSQKEGHLVTLTTDGSANGRIGTT
jgi:hypothetical protein